MFKLLGLSCLGVFSYLLLDSRPLLVNFVYASLSLLGMFYMCSGDTPSEQLFSYFLVVLSVLMVWFSSFLGQGFMLYLLLVCLGACFFTNSLMVFYMFFELALMPLYVIMVLEGATPERLKAVWGMFLYTLAGSLPLLFNILVFYSSYYSFLFLVFKKTMYSVSVGFSMFWVLAFLVKIPMFGFHSWLPVAHGEAPTFGSMVLGAMMLKLGMIGLFRVLPFVNLSSNQLLLLISWAVFGFFCSSLLALSSCDLKLVVAYSSVVHLSPVMVAMFLNSYEGMLGSIFMGVGHGFSSSMLFLGVGMVYGIRGFRSSYLVSGSALVFSFFWFLGCALNASMPPSINYFSEVFMFYSCFCYSNVMCISLVPSIVVSGVYCILLYTSMSHGSVSTMVKAYWGTNLKGVSLLGSHVWWSLVFMALGFSGSY